MLSKVNQVVEEILGIKEMKIISKWVYYPAWVAIMYAIAYWYAG